MTRSRMIQRAFAQRGGAQLLSSQRVKCHGAAPRSPSSAGFIGIRCTLLLVVAGTAYPMTKI